jgi:hypothetical protein
VKTQFDQLKVQIFVIEWKVVVEVAQNQALNVLLAHQKGFDQIHLVNR